jgi:hypothetical protein
MKLRLLAMATVAAAAFTTPALAGEGWYLGLGGGWDGQNGIRGISVPAPALFNQKTNSASSAIGAVAVGYKWAEGLRLENEVAFTQHDISVSGATGGNQILSDMVNLAYDYPISDTWKLTVGGGLGVAEEAMRVNGTLRYLPRRAQRLPVQDGGLAVSVAPDVDQLASTLPRERNGPTGFVLCAAPHPCLRHSRMWRWSACVGS